MLENRPVRLLLIGGDDNIYDALRQTGGGSSSAGELSVTVVWEREDVPFPEVAGWELYDVVFLATAVDGGYLDRLRDARRLGSASHPPTPVPPLILLLGRASDMPGDEARDTGIVDYLVGSDLSPDVLTRCLRYALNRARVERETIPAPPAATAPDRAGVALTPGPLDSGADYFRQIVETANEGIWVADTSGRATYVNDKIARTLGYQPEEMIGRSGLDFAHPEDRLLLASQLERRWAGHSGNYEARFLHRNGETVWLQLASSPLRDDDPGIVTGSMAVLTNITARKQTEEALRRETERFETIAAVVPGVLYSFRIRPDGSSHFLYASPGVVDLLGVTPEQMANKICDLIHPDDRDRVAASVAASARDLTPWKIEYRVLHPDKGEVWVEGRTAPVREPDGGTIWHGFLVDVTERKRTEEALQAGTREMRHMMGTARCLLWSALVTDRGGWFDYWDILHRDEEAAQRFLPLDVAPDESYIKASYRHRHPADRERTDIYARDRIRANQGYVVEFRCRGTDGEWHWHHEDVHIEPLGQNRWHAVVVTTDITAVKEAEIREAARATTFALVAGDAPLESVLESIVHGMESANPAALCSIVCLDEDDTRLRVGAAPSLPAFYNRATEGMRIGPEAGCCGAAVFLARRVVSENIATDDLFHGRHDLAARAGLASCWAEPILSRVGKVLGAFAIYHRESYAPTTKNIEEVVAAAQLAAVAIERKQTEDALRESEQRFRVTFEQAAVGILHIALDGRYARVNQKFRDLLGYTTDELLTLAFQRITHPDDLEANIALMRQALRGGITSYTIESRYLRKDGTWMWANITVSLVRDGSGEGQYFVAVVEDITRRKEAEEALRRLNAELEGQIGRRTAALEAANTALEAANTALQTTNGELEAFSYSVSHDLRAPLRAIDGFCRILIEDFGGRIPAPAGEHLREIRANARKMGALIDDLLRFSRLTRQPLRKQWIKMDDLLGECVAESRPTFAGRRVTIQIGELPGAFGDPALIKQVWLNLLGNAIKYTASRDEAMIQIGAARESAGVVYSIRDNGVGFDTRYAGKLFGVFQRLHGDEYEGTGVGLAIVERIIRRHGGQIRAEAEIGRGASFFFTLGAAEAADARGADDP